MANVSSSNGLEKRPKLRFPGFDEPWKAVSLHDVSEYRKNKISVAKSKYISTENMLQNFAGITPYTTDEEVSGVEFCVGDTLLANIRPYLRKAWLATHNGACSTDVLALYPSNITSVFLNSIIEQDRFIDYVMSGVKGSKMPRGDKSHILAYETAIPSELEQEKINSFMQLLHQRIEKVQIEIELLKKYKRGLIKALISGTVSFTGADSSSWKTVSLADIFAISAGGDIDRQNSSPLYSPDYPYPVYANALKNNGLYGYANYFKVDGDTITVSGRGEVGHAIARHCKYVPIVRLLSLVPKYGDDVDFYAYIINATSIYIESTGVPQLTSPQLGAVKVLRPPVAEQKQISSLLLKIDENIENEERLILNLNKMRTSMLQQLFI